MGFYLYLGANFTSRGKRSLLGATLTPRGELKNGLRDQLVADLCTYKMTWRGAKIGVKMSVDKVSVDKVSMDKTSVDKMLVDEMSVHKISVDEMSVDETI
jgi:hypothetical protein